MKLLSLFLIVFLCSCDQIVTTENPRVKSTTNNAYAIEVIDSCEYIVHENGMSVSDNYSFAITHKGNCKFCKVRNSKRDTTWQQK